MKLRQWKYDGVAVRFKVERITNRFWELKEGAKRVCQATPRITSQKGAEMLAELYKLGVKKEGCCLRQKKQKKKKAKNTVWIS